MPRIPFVTWIANVAIRLDGTYGIVTSQAGQAYLHGPASPMGYCKESRVNASW